jgi:serine phosphatase RsbU (regulator of sigma subunit)
VHTFLILSAVSATLVIIASLFYVNFAYEQERDKLSTRIATSSVRLSRAVLAVADTQDTKTIHTLISAFAALPEVECVKAMLFPQDIVEYWPAPDCDQDHQEDFLHVQPLRRGVKVLGEIDVFFTDDMIQQELSETILAVQIGIAILMATLLVVMVQAQRSIVLYPISKIVNAIQRIKDGEASYRVGGLKAAPELTKIATAIDDMADDIFEKDRQVKIQAMELETSNRELSGSLEQAKDYQSKLQNMADQATSMNELLRTQSAELKLRNEESRQNLNYASRFQHRLISIDDAGAYGLDITGEVRQLNEIGGDFFVGIDLGDRYAVFFADGTGHGVSGAMATLFMSMAVRNALALDPTACPTKQLADIHTRLTNGLQNRLIKEEDVGLGADATLLHYIKEDEKIVWASAKQPFVLARQNNPELVPADKISIGYEVVSKEFHRYEADFSGVGDYVVMFTDGLTDAPGGIKGYGFGKRRLIQLIEKSGKNYAKSRSMLHAIYKGVLAYMGAREPFDDMGMLIIRKTKGK